MVSMTYPLFVFFFNDTATTEIYTLSLHDALPISRSARVFPPAPRAAGPAVCAPLRGPARPPRPCARSEEHTSELQSQSNLVCRLLLEKKKTISQTLHIYRTLRTHQVDQCCGTQSH